MKNNCLFCEYDENIHEEGCIPHAMFAQVYAMGLESYEPPMCEACTFNVNENRAHSKQAILMGDVP